jgi:hypothetical protein
LAPIEHLMHRQLLFSLNFLEDLLHLQDRLAHFPRYFVVLVTKCDFLQY